MPIQPKIYELILKVQITEVKEMHLYRMLKLVNISKIFHQIIHRLKETWTNFRGADFDNISKSQVKLIEKFGAEGPKILWSVELGEGHSGAAI